MERVAAAIGLLMSSVMVVVNCSPSLDDQRVTCTLPAKPGDCRAAFPRYFFNRSTLRCESFIYGGCHSNENNFETMQECRAACSFIKKIPKLCRPDAETGRCRAHITRYFYNMTLGMCMPFVYGGCGGNNNRFEDMESCVFSCIEKPNTPRECLSRHDTGNCQGNFRRFYYNIQKRSCLPFSYSGCGGNNNNFISAKTCLSTCLSDKIQVNNENSNTIKDIFTSTHV
ncbi:carboxypeptidase inhibitor SmCI-like [Petromyzon marinus]|uniref:carboxypeptidase inhibitor SmCI-like n=1 Tax=Petromyzon marinus TaxID=7757 RepID=UPI003F70673E